MLQLLLIEIFLKEKSTSMMKTFRINVKKDSNNKGGGKRGGGMIFDCVQYMYTYIL